jgi:hypothetical protein
MIRTRSQCVAALLAALVVPPACLAAQADTTIVIGVHRTVHSDILAEDRELWIHTPTGYDPTGTARYPVLYLLDGPGHFHHASGVLEFLAAQNRMPPMIVVAVENTDRTRDLTPPTRDTSAQFRTAGGASAFLRFLRDELRPWVGREYRTETYAVLMGHSFGALFATQVLIEDPEAFDAYISISPSLWWDGERLLGEADSIFVRHPNLRGALYMTMGNEGGPMLAGAWGFARVLELRAPESFRWKWTHMPAEDHGSVPHRSLYDGLEWVFEGWQFPNLPALFAERGADVIPLLEAHAARLTERFGFTVRPLEGQVNQIAYALLRQDSVAAATRVFERNVERYPESANVYDSLGDAYDAACRWEEARASYERAVRRATETSHPVLATSQANLARVTAKLAQGAACPVSR